jgi:hypothetical protein
VPDDPELVLALDMALAAAARERKDNDAADLDELTSVILAAIPLSQQETVVRYLIADCISGFIAGLSLLDETDSGTYAIEKEVAYALANAIARQRRTAAALRELVADRINTRAEFATILEHLSLPEKVTAARTPGQAPADVQTHVIDGESLRTRMARDSTGRGRYSDPYPHTDLRGAPIGPKVEVWEWDRMILPRPGAARRVREHVEVMFCPEGWYCESGGAATPMEGGATCHMVLDTAWRTPTGIGEATGFGRDAFNAFHAEHPVTWRVRIKRGSKVRTLRYCDPELPAEYRPAGKVAA